MGLVKVVLNGTMAYKDSKVWSKVGEIDNQTLDNNTTPSWTRRKFSAAWFGHG